MGVALVRSDILYAWKGPSVLVVNTRGECDAGHPLSGYYFREARFLRTLRLTINGERPWLCEAAAVDPDLLTFNFVHPEIKAPGGGGTGQSGHQGPHFTDVLSGPDSSVPFLHDPAEVGMDPPYAARSATG